MSDAMNQVQSVIASAVVDVANDPANALNYRDAKPVSDALADKLAPMILSATNNEPWYQSRIVWMLVLGLGATLVKPVTGELIDDVKMGEIADSLTAGGQLVAFGLALYFRLTSKKPILPSDGG